MQAQTIEMPKKYREQLNELEVGGSFAIADSVRKSWANFISKFYRECKAKPDYNFNTMKQFTIRKTPVINADGQPVEETRIFRFK